ncbi:MAG: hypothetical protein HY710_07630 [Candidatus Latescibacteria bacterium]|nr:hypothetical protein [Candidatus Latescibacterota bacterium]
MTPEPSPASRPFSGAAELKRLSSRSFRIAFLIALALHLLAALIVLLTHLGEKPERTYQVRLLPYEPFRQPSQLAPHQFEIIDVPERARSRERPKEPTPLVADKNAIARDRVEQRNLPKGLPYSEGDSELKNTGPSGRDEAPPPGGVSGRRGGVPDFRETVKVPPWTREFLIRPEYRRPTGDLRVSQNDDQPASIIPIPQDDLDERRKTRDQAEESSARRPRLFGWDRRTLAQSKFRNKASVAQDVGDLSFSTLEWEYAPYAYDLRERIRQHWFPPPAFYMGLVSGRVILRFKIMRDGSVRDLEALTRRDDRAYQSLVASSLNAIRGANLFQPLPSDFPDPFLEITATFFYRILGENNDE